ncbi:alpha/beta fold hydrolase [Roseateles sp. LKC17W]|uniref:Alpha/beta fold hydrolase n=1 Tax=Pelomonas margarita TaxID=3299031 RepID=A0ABW7FJP8_9BURK
MTATSALLAPPPPVDRHFLRLPGGRLLHYRTAGASQPGEPPLLLAHAGPGSSAGLVPLMQQLARHRRVIAPDMPGNGDSEPLDLPRTEIADYLAPMLALLDALGVPQVDFCGQHTGAHIGCELALRQPARVRRLVLDGLALFEPELRAQMQARYAPAMVPDDFGGHLAWAWHFVNNMFVHFPHFMQDPAHRLNHGPVPPPAVRQALVVEMLKALPSYHLAYQAAFAHPTSERLPLLQHATLLMAVDGDPLARYLDAAARLLPAATVARMPREGRADAIEAFLAAPPARP